MAAGVGKGVGEIPVPACQLTGLFTPATTVSVSGWARQRKWSFKGYVQKWQHQNI